MTKRNLTGLLALGLIVTLMIGAVIGPYALAPSQIVSVLAGDRSDPQAVTVEDCRYII